MLHKRQHSDEKSVQAHGHQHRSCRASLTLECALILPLVVFCCITLISFMNAIRLQTETNLRLSNEARGAAVAASAAGVTDVPWLTIPRIVTCPLPSIFPIEPVRVFCCARVHVWDGSPLSAASSSGDGAADEMVYLSESGSVYHTHADCSHIELAIFQSTTEEIASLRNADGGKYKPCRGFPKNYRGTVYASESGDFYYPSLDYAALTRHVRCVSRKEAGSLHECSRCRERDHAAGSRTAA